MPIGKREGNKPSRRILSSGDTSVAIRAAICARVRYGGSAIHKIHPGNYGFYPPVNPRPSKSVCDDKRPILQEEANQLFHRGIMLGMISAFAADGIPKFVWAVDDGGEVYEAKAKPEGEPVYHGYRLNEDDRRQREYVLYEWSRRCLTI